MKNFALSLLVLWSLTVRAEEIKISADTFEAAAKAGNYFKFTGESSKLGLIGNTFEGYARSAQVFFERKGDLLQKVRLVIPVAELDTDNSSRNEKMRNTCLSAEKFPQIEVLLDEPVDQAKNSQKLQAKMLVRGKSVPLLIELEKIEGGKFQGRTSFKLSEAGIPDPSILVASVKDTFEVEFRIAP
jgi:polyisoprenoid-binding protein YceI